MFWLPDPQSWHDQSLLALIMEWPVMQPCLSTAYSVGHPMGVSQNVGQLPAWRRSVFFLEPLVWFMLVRLCWEMSFHPFRPRPAKECDPNWEDVIWILGCNVPFAVGSFSVCLYVSLNETCFPPTGFLTKSCWITNVALLLSINRSKLKPNMLWIMVWAFLDKSA